MFEQVLVCPDWDNRVRWQSGERLHHLFEQRCDQFQQAGDSGHLAVDSAEGQWSYLQLDQQANQLARYLQALGYGAGDVIGLLFDKSANSYLAMLAVSKIHAAYVPLDPSFPADRIAYIATDAGLKTILTLARYRDLLATADLPTVCVDDAATTIRTQASTRLTIQETGQPVSELCYIIYTSGSTGRPKGVPIEQASICNFVRVAAEMYGYTPADRVYQGLTIAFDFAVEEIWVPLAVGATLLPNQTGSSLLGSDLADFMLHHRVTAMCCVPTLLATIDQDIPYLRLLIVSGEACPQDLLARWYSPQRRILNAYGPTETTVTATLSFPKPGQTITIGKPLPTYSVVILEPGTENVLPFGKEGEIAVAGVGVARGYLNREDQTRKAFIQDFLHLPNNPSGLIYRTGDLGVINSNGDIEYRGRIDLQVKIRGYRIELTEIESVMLQLPGIAQAVVETFEPMPGAKELVAYYTCTPLAGEVTADTLVQALREKLPAYMVPAYYERLDIMPLMASDKADRKALPKPVGVRMNVGSRTLVEPRTPMEKQVAETLATLLHLEAVSVEDHFFNDLGASSLLMAQFATALRKKTGQTDLSMRDVYVYPSVALLAGHLEHHAGEAHPTYTVETFRIPSKMEYYTCGALQLLAYLAYLICVTGSTLAVGRWIWAAQGLGEMYWRTVGGLAGAFFAGTALAIAAKWLLIGKWQAEQIPIWSLRYFRFWVVRQLLVFSPMMLFRGYPLYNLYLRLLGAKIGRNVVLECEHIPVGTDLLSIGDNTILRSHSILCTYKARSNYLFTGPVNLGSHVVVGEGSVVDINTVMQDHAQLGHASALHERQVALAGKCYHGIPAQETTTDFRWAINKPVSQVRKVMYSLLQLGVYLGVLLPLSVFLSTFLIEEAGLPTHSPLSGAWFEDILVDTTWGIVGLLLLSLAAAVLVPRLLNLFLRENREYVRYGVHFFLFKWLQTWSNSPLLNLLFGDSAYITTYLQSVGINLSTVAQTGSNFGVEQRHDSPFLCQFGTRTMVSDGLNLLNAQHSPTAFRLVRNTIGADTFIGNSVFYPVGSKLGTNCLIATKAMIPIDGPLRENTGLLGSPSFEIPRVSGEDKDFDMFADTPKRWQGLRQKTRSNLLTLLIFVGAFFIYGFATLLLTYLEEQSSVSLDVTGWVVAENGFLLFTVLYFVLLERASLGFGRMQPVTATIYEREFWRVERMWKCSAVLLQWLWIGTPFRNLLNRALGVRQGKMVFDDGLGMTERTLVEIGDYCNFNTRSILQSHSLEQGRYKSDLIRVGNQCSIEPNAFIHYGVKIGDNAVIGTDSFVMKGETVEPNAIWRGNPARAV